MNLECAECKRLKSRWVCGPAAVDANLSEIPTSSTEEAK